MPAPDKSLEELDDEIINLLSEKDGLRIEEIADEKDIDFTVAQEIVHNLWDQNLVVSGPEFEFEADPAETPKIER